MNTAELNQVKQEMLADPMIYQFLKLDKSSCIAGERFNSVLDSALLDLSDDQKLMVSFFVSSFFDNVIKNRGLNTDFYDESVIRFAQSMYISSLAGSALRVFKDQDSYEDADDLISLIMRAFSESCDSPDCVACGSTAVTEPVSDGSDNSSDSEVTDSE